MAKATVKAVNLLSGLAICRYLETISAQCSGISKSWRHTREEVSDLLVQLRVRRDGAHPLYLPYRQIATCAYKSLPPISRFGRALQGRLDAMLRLVLHRSPLLHNLRQLTRKLCTVREMIEGAREDD